VLRSDRRLLGLAVGLSGLAGFVDAIGFLEAGGFFISFMSGNSTRLAVGVAEGTTAALAAVALIVGFVGGCVLGFVVGHLAGTRRRPAVTALVTLLLIAAALLMPWHKELALAAMVLAMGAENAALADNGEVKVGLTYMTGALVRLGQAAAHGLLGIDRPAWVADLSLWLGLVTGATLGALAQLAMGHTALWIAAGLAATLTILAVLLQRRAPATRPH